MPRVRVSVRGADKLRAKVKKLSPEMEKKLGLHILDTALDVERDAKAAAPVNDGFLRRSIRQRAPVLSGARDSRGRFIAAKHSLQRDVVTDAPYARAVEFGSRPHFPPVEPLERWAQKHPKPGGYEPGDGYAIALAISKRGTRAQPFLFPALEMNRAAFARGVRRIVKELD